MEGQENEMDATLVAEDGKTSDQILAEINKQKQGPSEPNEEPKPEVEPQEESKPDVPDKQEDKSSEPAPTSDAEEVAVPQVGSDKAAEEWMKKKGFKSTAEMARSLRNLERELSRRARGTSDRGTQIPRPAPQAPAYVPPSQSYRPPSSMIDELAKQYNMDPEDLQRVAPLAADIARNAINQQVQPLMSEIDRLNKQVSRKAEIDSLESDPAYQNPEVQVEMYQILDADPSIFQNEPAPYKYAFEIALGNIGRRNLVGKSQGVSNGDKPVASSGNSLPPKPPGTARGKSSSAASKPGISASSQINQATFASLPLAEKEKILKKAGAIVEEF